MPDLTYPLSSRLGLLSVEASNRHIPSSKSLDWLVLNGVLNGLDHLVGIYVLDEEIEC